MGRGAGGPRPLHPLLSRCCWVTADCVSCSLFWHLLAPGEALEGSATLVHERRLQALHCSLVLHVCRWPPLPSPPGGKDCELSGRSGSRCSAYNGQTGSAVGGSRKGPE